MKTRLRNKWVGGLRMAIRRASHALLPSPKNVALMKSLRSGFFPRCLGRNISCGAENSIGKTRLFPDLLLICSYGAQLLVKNSRGRHSIGRTLGPAHHTTAVCWGAKGQGSPSSVIRVQMHFPGPDDL